MHVPPGRRETQIGMYAAPPFVHLGFREPGLALEEDEDAEVGLGVCGLGGVEGGEGEGVGLGGGFGIGSAGHGGWV